VNISVPARVARRFSPVAALQLITFAARGFATPFVSLYLVSVGFTGTAIGLLASLSALAQLVIAPLLHNLADRLGRHRQLYYALITGNICACLGLVAFGGTPALLGAMLIFRDLSDTPGAALLSQLTLTWLERRRRQIFGRLRAWGSFGWALTTMISGSIFAIGGYPLLFMLAAFLSFCALPLIRVLPTRTAEPRSRSSPSTPRTRGFFILLASIFLYYVGATAFTAFSFIYYKRDLGASTQLIGVISSLAALSEIPAMMLIDRLLRRADIRVTLAVGFLGLAGLWFSVTQLTSTEFLIPLMLLRGTFYSMQIVSLTLLVSQNSDPGNVATNQALAQVTVPGLAALLTSPISGWLFDHAGPRTLFQITAATAVCSAVLLLIARQQLTAKRTGETDPHQELSSS
jgi:PPP family 3-phenylpropionic acid transporter